MNPLLTLPRVVAVEDGPDIGIPSHHGDPLAEQRAMDRSAAVVDRSNREVIAVPGEDRLSWLHLLLSQHVSELPAGSGTEALVLDLNGRVEHHMVVSHVDDTVWLDVEPGTSEGLLEYLRKMVFWSKVEPRSATDELALLSVVGPAATTVLTEAGVATPTELYGSVSVPGGGLVRRMPDLAGPLAGGSAHHTFDLLVPRAELVSWWQRLRDAGASAAGALAYEALRVGALRPRLGLDTDERTIPHEVGWIGAAVHLTKGCYRGQETVARVANLGRPPRKLVLLHTESGDDPLLPGDPVLLGTRTVGRVGSWALHHELGGVALALVKRSTPVDAELTAGVAGDAQTPGRLTTVRIDPDSTPAEDEAPPPGRAAQARTARALHP